MRRKRQLLRLLPRGVVLYEHRSVVKLLGGWVLFLSDRVVKLLGGMVQLLHVIALFGVLAW